MRLRLRLVRRLLCRLRRLRNVCARNSSGSPYFFICFFAARWRALEMYL